MDTESKKYLDYAALEVLVTNIKKSDENTLTTAKAYADSLIGGETGVQSQITNIKNEIGAPAIEDQAATGLYKAIEDVAADVAAEESARKAQIGELGKVKDAEGNDTDADHTVKSYVDATIAAADGAMGERMEAAEASIATLTGSGEGSVAKAQADAVTSANAYTDGLVGTIPASVGSTETKTVVAYVDAKDAALNADIAALKATHATNEDGSFKSVADEISEIVDGAPEALDTLKEIADWIANQNENGQVTDVASLLSRVETNASNISTLQGLVGNASSGLVADVASLQGLVGETAVATQISNAIGTLDVAEGADATVANAIAKEKADREAAIGTPAQGQTAATGVYAAIETAVAGAVGGKVESAEKDGNGMVIHETYVKIADVITPAEVNALFGITEENTNQPG